MKIRMKAHSEDDYFVLYDALETLSALEKRAIHLRYWDKCTIVEISRQLRMSWDKADQLIACTENKLRIEIIRRLLSKSTFDQNDNHEKRRKNENVF